MGSIISIASSLFSYTQPENEQPTTDTPISPNKTTFTLASRKSELAKIQTHIVLASLQSKFPDLTFNTLFMSTGGDKNQSQPLHLIGTTSTAGKSLWTEELEVALLKGQVDIIVHSLKDIPTVLKDGCEIGAILEREDPRDCLVVRSGLSWRTLEELPEGSVVGTSSVRRVAQLKRAYPKLKFADVRGNLNTRFSKLDSPTSEYTALILAYAGIHRLGLSSRITSILDTPYAVGQGALGIEIRSPSAIHTNSEEDEDYSDVKALVRSVNDWKTEWRCRSERALLRILEGGCSVPVAVQTSLSPSTASTPPGGDWKLHLAATVTSLSGDKEVSASLERIVSSAREAEAIGVEVAAQLLGGGATDILDEIKKIKEAAGKS